MFNPSHPFGTVHGSGNAIYYQGGKHYDTDHREVDIDTGEPVAPEAPAEPVAPEAPAEPVAPEAPAEPVAPEAPAEPVVPEAPEAPVAADEPEAPGFLDPSAESAPTDTEEVDLGSLPWQTVKKMVISAGGIYVDKTQGVAYLRGM